MGSLLGSVISTWRFFKSLLIYCAKGSAFCLGALGTALLAVTVSGNVTTFQAGGLISARSINENFASLKSAIEGLPECSEYSVQLRSSAPQTIPHPSVTILSWDQETFDGQDMHDNVNPSRVTVPIAGRYLVIGRVSYDANPNGNRSIRIHRNGAAFSITDQGPALSTTTTQEITEVMDLAAGDYLELSGSQDSGVSLSTTPTRDRFSVFRLCGN